MANGGDVKIKITADSTDAERGLQRVGDAAEEQKRKTSGAFEAFGKGAKAVAASAAAITAAVGGAATAIANVGKEWETSFAQVKTIMDETQLSAADMKAQILELSSASGIAASELSGSVYNAISATGDTAHAVELVGTASKLATAGFADTESSLSVLTTAMNAYGLSADQVLNISDSLIQTQNLGVTTVAELAAGMGKAIASASAYGVDLKNVEATYIAMTKSGISTAESTTYMSSMFKELGDSGSTMGKLLQEKAGQSFDQLMKEGKSLSDVLGILYDAVGRDSTALMNMWGSAEAGKAANAIINQGLETFNENLKSLADSSGTTESAYETMCNTVEHQTQLLQNTVKNLGISIWEDFSPDVSALVSQANGWMSELAAAYSSGGVDAMGEAATKILPKVLTSMTGMMQKAVAGVTKQLPSLFKNLVGALPDLFSGGADIASSLIEGLSGGFAAAVEALIGNLPQIFYSIVPAIGKTLMSLIGSVPDIAMGISNGLEKAFHRGQVQLMSGDWVEEDQVKTMNITLNTNVNTDGVETAVGELDSAKSSIENALQGITEIDGVNISEIAEGLINGDTTGAIEAALIAGGVDPKAAEAAAQTIREANKIISDAVAELGLNDAQKKGLDTLIDSGATKAQIEAYLTACGVDPQVAKDTAKTIYDAASDVNEAIKKFPPEIQNAIKGIDFTDDVGALREALANLGLNPSDIDEVIASYSTIADSLSTAVTEMFSNITTALTDGKKDTPEVINGLEEQVRGWAKDAYEKINEWYADELKNLNNSGLSGEAYQQKLGELNALKEGYVNSIQEAETATINLIGSSAGLVGEELDAALVKLDAAEQRCKEVSNTVDNLTSTLNKQGSGAYTAVSQGWTTDEVTVEQAVNYVYSFRIDAANLEEEKRKAIEKLNESAGDMTEEAYNAALEEINQKFDPLIESYKESFSNGMANLAAGLAEATGVGEEQITQALQGLDIGTALQLALQGGLNTGSLDGVSDEIKQKLAEALNINPDDLSLDTLISAIEKIQPEVAQALEGLVGENGQITDIDSFNIAIGELANNLVTSGTEAFNSLETGAFGEAIRGFIEAGVFNGISGIDLNGSGDLDFGEVLRYLSDGIQNALDGNPPQVTATAEATTEVNIDSENVDDQVSEVKEGIKEKIEESTDENTTEEIPVNASATVGEVTLAEGEDPNRKAQEAIENATAGGDVIVIEETAQVNLNVEATVSGTDFSAAGAQAAQQFAQGIASGNSGASVAASNLAQQAIGALQGADAQSLGASFGDGYALGIQSKNSFVYTTAVRLAKQALQGVKDGQKSASPSKLTRQLGDYFGEGYEIGIEESMRKAADTAKRMTGEVLSASVIGSNGLGVIRVEAGTEPLQVAMEGADAPIYLDGQQIASIQGGNNTARLQWISNRANRGMGR